MAVVRNVAWPHDRHSAYGALPRGPFGSGFGKGELPGTIPGSLPLLVATAGAVTARWRDKLHPMPALLCQRNWHNGQRITDYSWPVAPAGFDATRPGFALS